MAEVKVHVLRRFYGIMEGRQFEAGDEFVASAERAEYLASKLPDCVEVEAAPKRTRRKTSKAQ